ncbi:hypothetical protein DICPUDRAFT_78953 [Dictyostelium purpureum]|uniref:Uncharacterized protein n=1 Tax=Dictyostelium purpureum TaxID=5786 RepID=F0ZL42_DICPU|nr:uncharacterized protein DICPUDRAFT_78953 [Dictyostelium purpureum]EGC35326.1 hypothetical protein DICPUDRAFT_78953 [Dictyostelium purpureum]|eukprot:XP_003288133.1 hypothetical protein DICPUDRAFT_78953 [Dictyostelium purpureum]
MEEDLNSYFINLDWYSNNVEINKICDYLLLNNLQHPSNDSPSKNDQNENEEENLRLFFYNFITFLYNKKGQYNIQENEYIKIKKILERYGEIYEFLIVQNYQNYIYANYKPNEIYPLFHRLLTDDMVLHRIDYYDYYMMIKNNLDIINENGLFKDILLTLYTYIEDEKKKNIQTIYLFFTILLIRPKMDKQEFNKDLFLNKFIKYTSSLILLSSTESFKRVTNGINYIVLSSRVGRCMIIEFEEEILINNLEYLIKILNKRKNRITTPNREIEYNVNVLGLLEIFNCVQNKFKNIIESIIMTNKQYEQLQEQQPVFKEYLNFALDNGMFRSASLYLFLERENIMDLFRFKRVSNKPMPYVDLIILSNKLMNFKAPTNIPKNSIFDLIVNFSTISKEEIQEIFYNSSELEPHFTHNNPTYSSNTKIESIKSLYLNLYYKIKNNYSIENCLKSLFYKIESSYLKQEFIKSILDDLIINLNINLIDQYLTNSSIFNNLITNNKTYNKKQLIGSHNLNNNNNNNNMVYLPQYIIKYILKYLVNDKNIIDKLNLSLVNKEFFGYVSNLTNNQCTITMEKVLPKDQVNKPWSLIKVENITSIRTTPLDKYSLNYNKNFNNLLEYKALETIEINGSFCKSPFSDFIYLVQHPNLKTIIIKCDFLDLINYSSELEYFSSFKTFKFKMSIERHQYVPILKNFYENSILSISIPANDFIHEYFENNLFKIKKYIIKDRISSDDMYKLPSPEEENIEQIEKMKKFSNLSKLTFKGTNDDSIKTFLTFISGYAINLEEITFKPLNYLISIQSIFDLLSSNQVHFPNLKIISFKTKNNYSLSLKDWESIDIKSFKTLDFKYKTFYKQNNINYINENKNNMDSLICDISFKKNQYLEINSNFHDYKFFNYRHQKRKERKSSNIENIYSQNHHVNFLKSIEKYDFYQHETEKLIFYPTSFSGNKYKFY